MAELSNNAKELLKRGDSAFSDKASFDALCQTIAENVYPERADFTTDHALGEEFASDLSDGTPVLMRRDLGNARAGMLRPRGQPWFKHDVEDEELKEQSGVSDWLDYTTNIHRKALYASTAGFVRAAKENDHDLVAFGNGIISGEENERRDGLRFRCHHPRDCAFYENVDGAVDTLFRNFRPTARQMRQRWGEKALHPNVRDACEREPDKAFKVRHVMMPAEDYEYETKKRAPRGPGFVSVYIDCDNQALISEAPSWEFRYVVSRWQTMSGSQYAVSPPAMVSLPDARMLQALAAIIQDAGEKALSPPTKATEEAIRGEVNLYAGGTTWVDREYDERLGPAIEAIKLGENPGIGIDLLLRLTAQLKDEWYISKLTLPQQGAKTAYETSQLVEEFIRSNIPLFEPWEADNVALLELSSSILLRVGAFGSMDDIPQALRKQPMTFSFSNPLQDAIEKNRVYQFQTTTQLFMMAAGIDPAVKRDLNVRDGFRDAVRGSGAPADWLVDKDEADKGVAADEQATQVQNAVQQAGMAGQAGQDIGKGVQELRVAA